MTDSRRSFVFAGLAVLFWSTIATAFKLALMELSPVRLLLVASLTSLVVLTIIILLQKKEGTLRKQSAGNIAGSALMGLLNPFIYYLVLLKAYTLLPAQVAQPLNMIWPIVLVFLSVPMLGHRVPAGSFIALFISFAGVYLISSQGDPLHPGRSDTAGVLLATGSSIFWALYFILNLKDKRQESIKLFYNFLFATLYLLVFAFFTGELKGFSTRGILLGAYVGIFEMGLTFFLWLRALKLAGRSDRIGNLVFLAPFISLMFISLILHEKIHLTTIIGLVIITGSIIFQNWTKKESVGGIKRS